MPSNETYIDRRVQKTQLCTPFPITPRQLEVLQLTADGLHPDEISKQLGIATPTVKVHMQRLARWGGNRTNASLIPLQTTIPALIQDGINECYLTQNVGRRREITLTPFEEVIIGSTCNGEGQKDFLKRTGSPKRAMWEANARIRKKLKTKNLNHTIARYTWLKNRGYVRIEDPPPPLLTKEQRELLQLLSNGLNTQEMGDKLVLSKNGIDARFFSFKNIAQQEITTDPNAKPRELVARFLREGVLDGTITHDLATDQIVHLTTFEESLVDSILKNETSVQFAERNGLSLYLVSQAKKKLNEKLSTRTPLHLIARHAALKKAGLLEITD